MAVRLVESLSTEFDPAAYRNKHDEALRAFVESKGAAGEAKRPPAKSQGTEVIDLMEALERSLAALNGTERSSKRQKAHAIGV